MTKKYTRLYAAACLAIGAVLGHEFYDWRMDSKNAFNNAVSTAGGLQIADKITVAGCVLTRKQYKEIEPKLGNPMFWNKIAENCPTDQFNNTTQVEPLSDPMTQEVYTTTNGDTIESIVKKKYALSMDAGDKEDMGYDLFTEVLPALYCTENMQEEYDNAALWKAKLPAGVKINLPSLSYVQDIIDKAVSGTSRNLKSCMLDKVGHYQI